MSLYEYMISFLLDKQLSKSMYNFIRHGGFPGGSTGKEYARMWETWVLSLGWEDPLEKRKAGYPLQYSDLENSMDCMGS